MLDTVVPPYLQFHFPQFLLPAVNHSPKISIGKSSRNKQFINIKLCRVLSSVMKFHTIPLHPVWDVNYLFVQHIFPLVTY